MSDRPEPREKWIHVGAPACFELELAGAILVRAFEDRSTGRHIGCYLVGSALERPDWRDVDVRLIMQDDLFAETFPDAGAAGRWEIDPRWLLLTSAISAWLSARTGLPIDFQFQPMTHANERHRGKRNPIGLSRYALAAGGGEGVDDGPG